MMERESTLRVLFVIPGEAQGSSMIFARRQAVELSAHNVVVECFHLRSRTSFRLLWSEWRRFHKAKGAFAPHVVHAHFGTITALFAVLAAYPIPSVVTYRGSDLNSVPSARGPRAILGRIFSQLAALRASRIVCVSRALRERLWWRRNLVTILPSGVNTDVFFPMAQAEARAELGWNPEELVVLFNAGHDAHNKRLDLAKQSMERVAARLEVVMGNVPPERMPLFLNAADCLLVTSDAEGSPSIVQEAIATNLPVVSVDVGDVAERLEGVSGTYIVSRDPASLAIALNTVLKKRTRSDSRTRVHEISADSIADQLTHLYRQVVLATSPSEAAWNTTPSSQR
ncbi:MAG: glycosyltransferase [Acidobacteriota bacterium]